MPSTKWRPDLIDRKTIKALAIRFLGKSASNNDMANITQLIIAACNEQDSHTRRLGIMRAKYRKANKGDPDIADLMEPVGKKFTVGNMIKGTELERGRHGLASAIRSAKKAPKPQPSQHNESE